MSSTNPATRPIEPVVGTLRVAGGARLDGAPCAVAPTPPPRAARGRAGERLFILLDLPGPASPYLYRELREVVAQTYWSTAGSTTAALRQAAAAASRHLFRSNLRSDPSSQCYGSLVCAVLRSDDLFILQAGPAQPCVLREGRVERFGGEELPPLGMGPLAKVHLHHTFVGVGDTLLLASPALVQGADSAGLARVLRRAGVEEILAGLEQIGAGADFAALVVRWALPGEAPAADQPAPRPSALASLRRRHSVEPRESPTPTPKPRARPKPVRRPGPGLGERMGRGIRRIGHGVAAAGVWLVGGMIGLFRRMLPGPEREAHRRARAPRPIPKENRTLMLAVAVGIPILVAIVVALAYRSFGKEARFQRLLNQAEQEITLAQDAGGALEEARPHWEAALDYASKAVEWQPDDPLAAVLRDQAQAALDALDNVVRLMPIHLWDFGPSTSPRQLVIHGQMIFVLDPAAGWVVQLTLNPTRDGVIEREDSLPLIRTGQQIGEEAISKLMGLAWVEPGGERQTSGLVILEEDGALVSYDPAWGGAEEDTQLTRSLLGTPPTGTPQAVGSFDGRFYVLDVDDDQIWRYEPRGDTYPGRPDRYFVTSPPSLATAVDMAIDGNIYLLYADGTILKFLLGELQTFDVHGVPGGIGQAVALAVDPDGSSGVVYVADQGNERVVALEPDDGAFCAQFRAEGIFDQLESLAVDEITGRLYVIDGGRLYTAPLP